MFDLDKWTEIWATITRNKTRSLLTCFGVFWGILMLVILLGCGRGMKNAMFDSVNGFATNSAFLFADRTSKPYRGFNKNRSWDLRVRDELAIKKEVKGLASISGVLMPNASGKNVVSGQLATNARIKGVETDYFRIETEDVLFGRLLNEIDINEKRKVCLIGKKINDVLFRSGNPCGKYVKVNGLYYQVVGVVKQRAAGVNIASRAEETVFIPFSTLQQTLNQGDIIHFLAFSADSDTNIQPIIDQVKTILKRQNQIAPDDQQAVTVLNIAEMFGSINSMMIGIDILIWLVGLGTLFAGIIGVSNIMMVTVRERTKEIGVKRALGAKPRDIIIQIMTESLILTAIAGLIGLTCGVGILDLLNKIFSANPTEDGQAMLIDPGVDINTALLATVILLLCGLLSGLIPAWRAMQIKAIDAIREE